MKVTGIICEYNPLHLGHIAHIVKTGQAAPGEPADDSAVICVMSGNYVQRGDFALFSKHARAKSAVSCGADLVIELPVTYVLQSAEGFARAGVYLLEKLGICDYLSFGSESGEAELLNEAAKLIASGKATRLTKEWLGKGISYAAARQKAADIIMGSKADVFLSPNNVLGIEYIKAINEIKSKLKPVTIKRTGGEHDSETGYSASSLRKVFLGGSIPADRMHPFAAGICIDEMLCGRGPVSILNAELAILSRLRMRNDYSKIAGISEGLEKRFEKHAGAEATIEEILRQIKTKRYTMSRLRRILLCAAIGIKTEDTQALPQYIRVLAMNEKGKKLLSKARKKARLPIITKPASVYSLNETAIRHFELEAKATDLYVLAYQYDTEKRGGQEWRTSPVVI